MSSYGFYGWPGEGKTHEAVRLCKRLWEEKGTSCEIFSNIPLIGIRYTWLEDLAQIESCTQGTILCDDIGSSTLASQMGEQLPKNLRFYLQQHRKEGVDLVWTGIHPSTVNIAVRQVTARVTWVRRPFAKVRLLGLWRKMRCWEHRINQENPKKADCLRCYWSDLSEEIFDCYDTFNRFEKGRLVRGGATRQLPPVVLRGCRRVVEAADESGRPHYETIVRYQQVDERRGILITKEDVACLNEC